MEEVKKQDSNIKEDKELEAIGKYSILKELKTGGGGIAFLVSNPHNVRAILMSLIFVENLCHEEN